MTNHACIAIGIDRYQSFQPLVYAQADAQEFKEFLVKEAEWSADLCILLTETSPPLDDRETYPNKEAILAFVEDLSQKKIDSWDWLWFFFSGYGISHQGEDYLMPIDGDPEDIAQTGISVRSLFESLKLTGASRVLAFLDINRAGAGATVGAQTVELAHNLGIATILSAQLDQFSYEAAPLGHGLFTAALLEALRYDPNMTVLRLEKYLRDRLPELSEHHWRPIQTPLVVLPAYQSINSPMVSPALNGAISTHNTIVLSDKASVNTTATVTKSGLANTAKVDTNTAINIIPNEAKENIIKPPGKINTRENPMATDTEENSALETSSNTPGWKKILYWGAGLFLVGGLIGGVVIRNQKAFTGEQPDTSTSSNRTPSDPFKPTQPPTISRITTTTTTTTTTKPGNKVSPKVSPKENGKPKTTPQNKPALPPKPNQTALDKARSLIRPNLASQYNKAIAEARKIPPNSPLYPEASKEISRWSNAILDLAKVRATQGDFQAAVAAADLVPSEQPIYNQAQQRIGEWRELAQQQRSNLILVQAAKGLIKPEQASTYNNAITTARKVPTGEPGYAQAQELIVQSSNKIYLLAVSRASKGKFLEAIQAAALVPEKTPAYNQAQKSIREWKLKLRS